MSNQFTKYGTISMYSEKPWQDRETGQNIVLVSFQLQGDKRYYRCGTTPLAFREGASIQFVCDSKGNVDISSLKEGAPQQAQMGGAPVLPSPPAPSASPAQPAQQSGGASSRDGYWANKEARDLEKDQRYQGVDIPRIVLANCQGNAVRLACAALENDALSFGTVAKGKKLDMLQGFVDQLTQKFVQDQMRAHEIIEQMNAGEWNFGAELAEEQAGDLADE